VTRWTVLSFARTLGLSLVLSVGVLACGGDRRIPLANSGFGLKASANPEQDLRLHLVRVLHAKPDEAECIARELFKDPPTLTRDGAGQTVYTYAGADFEEPAARCGVDMDDLWTVWTD
jgi:hypothetical protein